VLTYFRFKYEEGELKDMAQQPSLMKSVHQLLQVLRAKSL